MEKNRETIYTREIKDLLRKIHAVPFRLVMAYMQKLHPKLPPEQIDNIIYGGGRDNRWYYDQTNNIVYAQRYIEIDARTKNLNKALLVFLYNIVDEPLFNTMTVDPWLIQFISNQKVIHVGVIPSGMETLISIQIKGKAMLQDEKNLIRRIAIVDETTNIDAIQKLGFVYFCTVDIENMDVKIVATRSINEAYDDAF